MDVISRKQTWSQTGEGCRRHKLGVGMHMYQLLVTPWTAAHQAPLSMGFSRQENSTQYSVMAYMGKEFK